MTVARLEKFSGGNLNKIALYNLHRDCDFVASLCDYSKPGFRGWKFRNRETGQIINYFSTVKDFAQEGVADYINASYPILCNSLKKRKHEGLLEEGVGPDWLEYYAKLVAQEKVAASDITIVAFGQTESRSHFNTLIITSDDENKIHASIIEPRSSNIAPWFFRFSYNIERSLAALKKRLPAIFGVDNDQVLTPKNPKLELQEFTNDIDCGAHHVNVVEMASRMTRQQICREPTLIKYLRATSILSRVADQTKVKRVGEIDQVILDASIAGEIIAEDKPPSDKDGFVEVEPIARKASVSEAEQLDIWIQKDNIFHAKLNEKIKVKHKNDDIMPHVIGILKSYPASNGFFTRHTRHKTVEILLNKLTDFAEEQPLSAQSRYKSALILFASFSSINDNGSQLKLRLGRALSVLLDCEESYLILKQRVEKTDARAIPEKPLFEHQLHLMEASFGQRIVDKKQSDDLFKAMQQINELDTSLRHHESTDRKREQIFNRIGLK